MSRKRDGTDPVFAPRRPAERELEASVAHGFTLAAVGDCISPRPLVPLLERDDAFARVVELLRRAGAAFGNLETSILDVRALRAAPRTEDDWCLMAPARRAGVQRVTVYNHFPDDASLLAACSAHWRALHPAPDPEAWLATADPGTRLRLGLGELYAWYRETEPMTANVLRDAELLPALRPIIERGLGAYLERVRRTLAAPFRGRGRRGARVDAAAHAAVDFHLWRALAPLGDPEAAELAAGLVEAAASG